MIGETRGYEQSKYADWLRGNVNTNLLAKGTPIAEGQYACIDAVEMAVNDATMVSAMGSAGGNCMKVLGVLSTCFSSITQKAM